MKSRLIGPGDMDDVARWKQHHPAVEVTPVSSWMGWRSAIARAAADNRDAIVQAHSAGTPGVVAIAARVPFQVTVYGSEIFAPRNRLAAALTTYVLRQAEAISVTSPAAEEYVSSKVASANVHHFSLGYGGRSFYLRDAEPVAQIVSVRRFLENYRILEILDAFEEYQLAGGSARLVLLQGHVGGDFAYAEQVHERIGRAAFGDSVEVRDEILTQDQLGELLGSSRAVVSVPDTDQLSTTLLEGLASGCSLVLSEIKSYEPLWGIPNVHTANPRDVAALAASLTAAASAPSQRDRQGAVAHARELNSKVLPAMQSFYGFR